MELNNKIKKIAFIYLIPEARGYYVTDDLGYRILRRPQLGLQYLCAVVEKNGIESNIYDQAVSFFNLDWLIKKLKEDSYNMAGFYCADVHEDKIKIYCKRIKETLNIPILVGGPGAFANSSFLNHGCDIVVHGEGETTIQHIIEYYNGKKDIEEIRGISYKKNNKIIKAPLQELIKNLDELPFPNRSKININAYYDYFLLTHKKPYVTVIASRGCVYKCYFCNSYKIWQDRYRQRSVDNVILEIDELVEEYKIKYIAFQDDIFGLSNNWIKEFCNKLIKKTYKIRWMPILHPTTVVHDTENILGLMKKAGCGIISFGLQSAHPDILTNVNRNPSEPQQLKEKIKIANKLGIISNVTYIFGLPGDTKETIQTTIDYSLDCGSTLANFYILSVFKGSDIERLYKNKKICDLSEEELIKLTTYAGRKFYMRPTAILKIAYFIIKNPEWLFKAGFGILSVLARMGFVKVRVPVTKVNK